MHEAARYIARQQGEREAGCAVTFTIHQKAGGWFCGLVELRDIDHEHSQGELSFWLTSGAWGRGYMSEVVRAVVQYGFEGLGLNRLYAYNMLRNPASGRVLEKNGFKQEGLLRQIAQQLQQEKATLAALDARRADYEQQLDKEKGYPIWC